MSGDSISGSDHEVALLRSALVDLLVDEQELLHVIQPNLEAIHLVALGAWELRQLQEEIRVRRLRLKLDRITAALNAARAFDPAEIDRQIEFELAGSVQRMRTLALRIEGAGRSLAAPMSDADEERFKRTHRMLVERAHPRMFDDPDPVREELWRKVCEAYQRHSIAELEKLVVLPAGDGAAPINEPGALRVRIAERMRAISELRQRPPFTLERWLSDESWLAGRRTELEEETLRLTARADVMEAGLARLLPAMDRARGFGPN